MAQEHAHAAPRGQPAHAPLPRSVSVGKLDELDLESRIKHVEHCLILREENMRRSARHLGERVQEALRPARLLWPLAGLAAAGAAGFGLYMLWRGRRHPAPAAADRSTGSQPSRSGWSAVPWVRLMPMALPFLPQGWRSRVSPTTASALLAAGIPMLESLLSSQRAAALQTAAKVDLTRYAGTWFVVASLSGHGLKDLREAAKGWKGNDQNHSDQANDVSLKDACERWRFTLRRDGLIDFASEGASDAVMQPVPGSHGAQLKTTRWPPWLQLLPMAWQPHWVLHVDDDYSEAVVGSPRRDALWLLSRRPHMSEQRLTALVQLAQDRGFDVQRLHFHSPH